jgi:phospholipid/cholesterol/gamma-HCH transport system permease protein
MTTSDAIQIDRSTDRELRIRFRGAWRIDTELPAAKDVIAGIASSQKPSRIVIDAHQLTGWDSKLLTFLNSLETYCDRSDIPVEHDGLPGGVKKLLELARAVPERKGARKEVTRGNFLTRTGASFLGRIDGLKGTVGFVGESFIALVRFFTGRANYQRADLMLFIQEAGAEALPIVTLISVLIGLIFAFVGAVQLVMFGAQIFVANLVAIAVVRVMGAVMVAVIMAGRTGAAYAAQLGTMQVNEEIDALQTLGISPMEFLVLPRMVALIIMMPMLCLYADLMGLLGGLIVGVGMLDLGLTEYLNQTRASVSLANLFIGLVHALVFGILIALSGCLRGMQCGRSASAVGLATTSAVVTAITSIVVATAIITVICNVLGV